MKNWIVRIGALPVFIIVVPLLIVLLVPGVRGAWGVLWGAEIGRASCRERACVIV